MPRKIACHLQRYAEKNINHYNNAEKNSIPKRGNRTNRGKHGLEIRITETRGWLNYFSTNHYRTGKIRKWRMNDHW